ncbi:hypothetical protein MASR2M78_11930 [Treponema sp.]
MWDYFKPEESKWYRWNLDGAEIYLRKNGDEWRTLCVPARFQDLKGDSSGPLLGDIPEGATVSFAVANGTLVALKPVFGELPYLITARNDVRIMSGEEACFDVVFPVSVRIELGNGENLGEFMPFSLSNTWFGDKTSGSLCWSIPTALDPRCKGEIEQPLESPVSHRSLLSCEIIVHNDSKVPLDLKRLAIYTDMLNIYEENGALVTDTVHVDGLGDGSLRMRITDSTPSSKKTSERKLLSAARLGQREFLVRRGVNFLRSVTGL